MTYDELMCEFTLATGTKVFSTSQILGINESGENIYMGYDSPIPERLNAMDRAEIADEMIRRWTAWKSNA